MRIFNATLILFIFSFSHSYGSINSIEHFFLPMAMMGIIITLLLQKKSNASFWWVLLIGFLLDSLSTDPWGTYLISSLGSFFFLVFFKSKIISQTEDKSSLFLMMFVGFFVFCIFVYATSHVLDMFWSGSKKSPSFVRIMSFWNFLHFFVFGYFFFIITRKFEKIFNLKTSGVNLK